MNTTRPDPGGQPAWDPAWQTALVLGFGRSGQAVAGLLAARGVKVTACDALPDPARTEWWPAGRVDVRAGWLSDEVPAPADVCVVSPGLALTHPWLLDARRRGIPVISEIEVAARFCKRPFLAITGTNGKSTLVAFCAAALQAGGLRARPVGNYGYPFSAGIADQDALDWFVVEVSSFQLETIDTFHPRIGVLLNIQPDHLNRHLTLETYQALKYRLFGNMTAADTAVVNAALPVPAGCPARCRTFGPEGAYRYRQGWIEGDAGTAVRLTDSIFDNPVLGQAAAAAVAALTAAGVAAATLESAFRTFQALPHRMQLVGTVRGVRCVNDSKATNLASMSAALAMLSGPIHLILGGRLKEEPDSTFKEILAKRVKAAYFIGEAAERLHRAAPSSLPRHLCGTLENAVRRAMQEAVSGDTILLSPACASFDQFCNYEHRGEMFCRLITQLKEEEGGGRK